MTPRWGWWRRRCGQPEPPVSAQEAAQARAESEEALEQARGREREVRGLAQRLKAQREDNHFADLIRRALEEGR